MWTWTVLRLYKIVCAYSYQSINNKLWNDSYVLSYCKLLWSCLHDEINQKLGLIVSLKSQVKRVAWRKAPDFGPGDCRFKIYYLLGSLWDKKTSHLPMQPEHLQACLKSGPPYWLKRSQLSKKQNIHTFFTFFQGKIWFNELPPIFDSQNVSSVKKWCNHNGLLPSRNLHFSW